MFSDYISIVKYSEVLKNKPLSELPYRSIETNNFSAEFAAAIDDNGVATNVSNGSSVIKFGTANVDVEAVGSADPADPWACRSGRRSWSSDS